MFNITIKLLYCVSKTHFLKILRVFELFDKIVGNFENCHDAISVVLLMFEQSRDRINQIEKQCHVVTDNPNIKCHVDFFFHFYR